MKKTILNMKKYFIFVMILIYLGLVCAQSNVNYCCEKTKTGAFCQNAPEAQCDTGFRSTPTSCDSTSFCKKGCCIDSDDGLCMENTPQKVCQQSQGTWVEDNLCNVPQCSLGCCILGDQASFVTQTRCKSLSAFYALETNFQKNVDSEVNCILTVQNQDRGACVYELDGRRTCKIITRAECTNLKTSGNSSKTEFFKDYLCSAEELATNCGPTTETICISGKDEIYFKDSCGNPANIYDSSKISSLNKDYWKKIVKKENSCNFGQSNINSRTCGNCDYFKGSMCGKTVSPVYGDYSCKDLNCHLKEEDGGRKEWRNGESWCYSPGRLKGYGSDLVGNRDYRKICINGEVLVEACDDYRAKICIQGDIPIAGSSETPFREAGCAANRWNDCMFQDEEEDCENTDKRDCYWQSNFYYFIEGEAASSSTPSTSQTTFSGGNTGGFGGGVTAKVIQGSITGVAPPDSVVKAKEDNLGKGICLPKVAPGLKFWSSGDSASVCSLATTTCNVKVEKSIAQGEQLKDNAFCEDPKWAIEMNKICVGLGDCGAYYNIAGKYSDKGMQYKIDGTKKNIGVALMNSMAQKAGV